MDAPSRLSPAWLQALLQPLEAPAFMLGAIAVSRLELVAVVLAVWMVVCNMRVNPLAWPLAIVSSALYFGLFWRHRLYGDASLQVVFAVVAGWGWWQWLRGHESSGAPLRVRALSGRGRWAALLLAAAAWPLLGGFLDHATDTDVPYWDAFPTAGSLLGQWLLGRKYVENWPVWLVVNVASVGLFAYKGLWPTAALYTLFIAMSWIGWQRWRTLATTA